MAGHSALLGQVGQGVSSVHISSSLANPLDCAFTASVRSLISICFSPELVESGVWSVVYVQDAKHGYQAPLPPADEDVLRYSSEANPSQHYPCVAPPNR